VNKIWWIILAVVVVGGLWLWSKNGSLIPTYESGNPAYSPASSLKASTKNKSSGSPGITATPASNPAFSQLEMQYRNLGQLIEFNDLCHSTPAKIVVKSGAKLMLDNRSSIPKTIRLDSDYYDLPAYTYRFAIAKTTHSLPYNLGIDCKSSAGSSENETTINIEALISNGL
jgi:hypothetical protein